MKAHFHNVSQLRSHWKPSNVDHKVARSPWSLPERAPGASSTPGNLQRAKKKHGETNMRLTIQWSAEWVLKLAVSNSVEATKQLNQGFFQIWFRLTRVYQSQILIYNRHSYELSASQCYIFCTCTKPKTLMYLDVSWCLQFITVQSPQSALERLGAAWDLPSDSPLTTAPASGDKPLLSASMRLFINHQI